MRQSKTRKLSKKKAWKYFSKYVRKSNADHRGIVRCFTCNKPCHWKKIHAGHFMSRRYEATLFDEQNVQPQCTSCNTFNQGRQFRFAKGIDKKYGDGTADWLEKKSKMKAHRKQHDYERIAKEYKQKLDELESINLN